MYIQGNDRHFIHVCARAEERQPVQSSNCRQPCTPESNTIIYVAQKSMCFALKRLLNMYAFSKFTKNPLDIYTGVVIYSTIVHNQVQDLTFSIKKNLLLVTPPFLVNSAHDSCILQQVVNATVFTFESTQPKCTIDSHAMKCAGISIINTW